MRYLIYIFGIVFLTTCTPIEPLPVEPPLNDFKVHTIYVVPAGQKYVNDNAVRVWRSVYATQNWFQTATGGVTFEILDEENVIEIYDADHPVEYYQDDWWGLLQEELLTKGYPIESKGTVLMLFIEGVSEVSEEDLALGSWSCEGECGAAIFPITTVQAPTRLPVDMGSIFHELGHAFGLTHPVEQPELPLNEEEEAILYSVMCETDIRESTSNTDHGLLTSEKAALLKNPFMKQNVFTYQDIWTSRIINYPVLGDVPEPEITFEVLPNAAAKFTSNIEDGLLYYWYFGDGTVSTEKSPEHTYNRFGVYNVTLMVTTEQYMSARTSSFINLN